MAKQIIIATHSDLAEGFKAALKFFSGTDENVHSICAFSKDIKPEESIDKCLEEIPAGDKVIVFTDIAGGSVNQLFSKKLINHDFFLVTGTNLSLLLELSLLPEDELNEPKILEIIEQAKCGIKFVNREYFDTLRKFDTDPANEESDNFFN